MLEGITFLLAVIGYAGLTVTAVLAARGDLPTPMWRLAVAAIVAHVVLVWDVRYAWRLSEATRNGYFGFVIFHGALVLIVLSVLVAETRARVLVWAAFAIVSMGAIGAVFRYDVVARYRVPVVALAAGGATGLAHAYKLSRRA